MHLITYVVRQIDINHTHTYIGIYAYIVLWPIAPYSYLANKPTHTHIYISCVLFLSLSVCVHIDMYSYLSMHECPCDRQIN